MLTRDHGYLRLRSDGPDAARQLEAQGWALLAAVLTASEVDALTADVERVYREYPPDGRSARRAPDEDQDFRYQMFNRSGLAQRAIGHPQILAAIEPLLGEDCHVIANTCWRNPAGASRSHGGGFWHIDAGPHVPRDPQVPWDDRIPYPVFAIGAHIYLRDCPLACGPTGVIPGSHRSGQAPPRGRHDDPALTWHGQRVLPLVARAGDVALFVSDVWHRRLPTGPGDTGRLFLQAHYGRRDIAQRVRTTAEVNHVSAAARARIGSDRERRLLGLHDSFFYDG